MAERDVSSGKETESADESEPARVHDNPDLQSASSNRGSASSSATFADPVSTAPGTALVPTIKRIDSCPAAIDLVPLGSSSHSNQATTSQHSYLAPRNDFCPAFGEGFAKMRRTSPSSSPKKMAKPKKASPMRKHSRPRQRAHSETLGSRQNQLLTDFTDLSDLVTTLTTEIDNPHPKIPASRTNRSPQGPTTASSLLPEFAAQTKQEALVSSQPSHPPASLHLSQSGHQDGDQQSSQRSHTFVPGGNTSRIPPRQVRSIELPPPDKESTATSPQPPPRRSSVLPPPREIPVPRRKESRPPPRRSSILPSPPPPYRTVRLDSINQSPLHRPSARLDGTNQPPTIKPSPRRKRQVQLPGCRPSATPGRQAQLPPLRPSASPERRVQRPRNTATQPPPGDVPMRPPPPNSEIQPPYHRESQLGHHRPPQDETSVPPLPPPLDRETQPQPPPLSVLPPSSDETSNPVTSLPPIETFFAPVNKEASTLSSPEPPVLSPQLPTGSFSCS